MPSAEFEPATPAITRPLSGGRGLVILSYKSLTQHRLLAEYRVVVKNCTTYCGISVVSGQ